MDANRSQPLAPGLTPHAAAENVTSGSGKALRVAWLWLAALGLPAFFFLGHHFHQIRDSQKSEEITAEPKMSELSSKTSATRSFNPKPPLGALVFVLQVGAMAHEENANALAESLRQKNFPTFVSKSETARFYRVVVGPYKDANSIVKAKNELEKQGFKAIRTELKPGDKIVDFHSPGGSK